jgi:hypothetical protein
MEFAAKMGYKSWVWLSAADSVMKPSNQSNPENNGFDVVSVSAKLAVF